jgi:hypothetical protein
VLVAAVGGRGGINRPYTPHINGAGAPTHQHTLVCGHMFMQVSAVWCMTCGPLLVAGDIVSVHVTHTAAAFGCIPTNTLWCVPISGRLPHMPILAGCGYRLVGV